MPALMSKVNWLPFPNTYLTLNVKWGPITNVCDVVCRYNAYEFYERNPELRQCVEQIRSGFFSPGEPGRFAHIADVLLQHDRFLHLADFDAYVEAQQKVADAYQVCF